MRISNQALAGCYDFLSSKGVPVQGRPMASVVPQFIEGVVTSLRKQSKLNDYKTPDEAQYIVDMWIGAKDVPLDFGDEVSFDVPSTAEAPTKKEALRHVIEEYVSDVADTAGANNGKVYVPEAERQAASTKPAIDLSTPPWQGIVLTEFAKVSAKCPKNQWVEMAATDPVAKRTLEVVCTHYPHWGTETMDKICAQTYAIFEPYKELL